MKQDSSGSGRQGNPFLHHSACRSSRESALSRSVAEASSRLLCSRTESCSHGGTTWLGSSGWETKRSSNPRLCKSALSERNTSSSLLLQAPSTVWSVHDRVWEAAIRQSDLLSLSLSLRVVVVCVEGKGVNCLTSRSCIKAGMEGVCQPQSLCKKTAGQHATDSLIAAAEPSARSVSRFHAGAAVAWATNSVAQSPAAEVA